MQHKCTCRPNFTYTWSNAELQAAQEAHPEGRIKLGPRTYELVSQRVAQNKHVVRLKDVS